MTGFGIAGGVRVRGAEAVDALATAAEAGWQPLFVGEVAVNDALAVCAAAAARRPGVVFGTSIVPLGSRSLATLALSASTVVGLAGTEFYLGVGVSTPAIVSGWHRQDIDDSLATTSQRLRDLREILDGARRGAFRLAHAPGDQVKILLGTLGPRMTELGLTQADGVVLNLTPTEALPEAATGQVWTFLWTEACQDSEPLIRRELVGYCTAGAYARHLTGLGYGAAVEQVQALQSQGRLRDAPATLPDELVERLYVRADAVKERIAETRAAGAEPVIVPVVGAEPVADLRRAAGNYAG